MDRDRLKFTIQENSNELARLHTLVHETLRHRDESAPDTLSGRQHVPNFMPGMTVWLSPEVTRVH
jgi:hypothetical protein